MAILFEIMAKSGDFEPFLVALKVAILGLTFGDFVIYWKPWREKTRSLREPLLSNHDAFRFILRHMTDNRLEN